MAYEVTDSNGPLRNRRHPAWWTNVSYDAMQPRPTADLEKGVRNLPEVLNELEEMSASELKSLLTLSTDPSVVGLHTAAQMEVVHERIRGLLEDDSASVKHEPMPPGYVYLLKMYGVTKVGVTGDVSRRMKEHRRKGWKQVRV